MCKKAINIRLLSRGFFKAELAELLKNKTILYPITLHCLNCKVTLYSNKRTVNEEWLAALKKSFKYVKFPNYYTIQVIDLLI